MKKSRGEIVLVDFKRRKLQGELPKLRNKQKGYDYRNIILLNCKDSPTVEIIETAKQIDTGLQKIKELCYLEELEKIQHSFDKMLYMIRAFFVRTKIPNQIAKTVRSLNEKFVAINECSDKGIFLQPREIGDICEYVYTKQSEEHLFITAIHKALLDNNFEVLSRLIQNNKGNRERLLNSIDSQGHPQLASCLYKDKKIIKLLLDSGLDPLFHRNGSICLLDMAILYSDNEVVSMFLQYCSPSQNVIKFALEYEEYAQSKNYIIPTEYRKNIELLFSKVRINTLLSLAIKANATERVIELIGAGLSVEPEDFSNAIENDNYDIVNSILQYSNQQANQIIKYPVHLAIENWCSDALIRLLLDNMYDSLVDLLEKDNGWSDIFIIAAIKSDPRYLKTLINYFLCNSGKEANVVKLRSYLNRKYRVKYIEAEFINDLPYPCLEHAIILGDSKIVALLIRYGADLNIVKRKYNRKIIPNLLNQPFFYIISQDLISNLILWDERNLSLEFGYYKQGLFRNLLLISLECSSLKCAKYLLKKKRALDIYSNLDYILAVLPRYDKKLIDFIVEEGLIKHKCNDLRRVNEIVVLLKSMPLGVFNYLLEKIPQVKKLPLESLVNKSRNKEIINWFYSHILELT